MTGPLPHPHRGDRLSEGPGGNRVTGSGPSRVARSDEGAARTIARQAYAAGAPARALAEQMERRCAPAGRRLLDLVDRHSRAGAARLGPLPAPEPTEPHP